jgi:hypothetical protein
MTSYAGGISLIVGGAVIGLIGFAVLNVGIAFFVSMLFDSADLSPAVRYGLGFIITALLYLVIGPSLFWWQSAASQSRGLFRRGVRLNSSAISSGCRKSVVGYWYSTKRRKNIMIEQTTSQDAHKKGLQRQIRQTSDSLRDTVEQIQDTAEQKYQAVKKTVSDVLDYREEFQKEPVVWTVGALSAGFAAGYAVGYSHKLAKNKKGSQFANFADTVVNDLSRLGQRLFCRNSMQR